MKRVSIIVPVYNEEETIEIYYNEVWKHLPKNYEFNVVFVNDGSQDNTQSILEDLSKKDDRIKYIKFSRNFGKEAAMLAGLEFSYDCLYDATVIMDVDLQDPPELIADMIKYYEEGYKHIYAKHASRKDEPWLRTFFAMRFYKIYAWLTNDKHVVRGARDFSLMDRDVLKAFIDVNDYTRFTKGIFSWVGFEKKCIEFDYIERSAGTTKWNFFSLFKYAMRGINQFSHFYKIIPRIAVVLFSLLIIADLFILDLTSIADLKILSIEIMLLIMTVILTHLMNLNYDIRDHGLNRPKYIVENTNIEVDLHAKTNR